MVIKSFSVMTGNIARIFLLVSKTLRKTIRLALGTVIFLVKSIIFLLNVSNSICIKSDFFSSISVSFIISCFVSFFIPLGKTIIFITVFSFVFVGLISDVYRKMKGEGRI